MKYCPFCKSTYENQVATCGRADCTGAGQSLRTLGDGPEARYDLHDRQADTGAFELWRARDRVTQADVAFTIVAKTSESEQERIESELRILRKVRHAHVAGIADSGRMADGRIFFVSEAQDGTTLDASFDKGVWSFQRAKRVVRQVGEGLLEIHKLGVLHRDLSPRNVLLSRTGEAKILNMVLAPGGKSGGEKDYLSPEQLAGRAVDRRANTYNLAAVLYRLVTGHVARPADAPGADVVPPSQRCSTNGLTAEIDRLILKALDAQPGNRPPTLRTFLAEVEALTSREGEAAKPAETKPAPVETPAAKPAAVEPPVAKMVETKAAPVEVKPAPAEAPAAKPVETKPAPPAAPVMPSFARPAVSARLAAISAARPAGAPAAAPAKASEAGVVAKPVSAPASGPRRAEPAPAPASAPAAPAEAPSPAPARSSTVAGFATLSRLEQEKLAKRLEGEAAEAPSPKPAAPAENGALAKDDIAKLLSATKARPAAPEPAAPKAPELPPAPPEEPAAPAAVGGSLGRNDIASLLSAAKAKRTSGGEPASAGAAEKPVSLPADDASLDVKKKLIEQMVRQSKASMPVVAAAPAPAAAAAPAPPPATPAAEPPVTLAAAPKPAAPAPSLPPKPVEPADSPDFVDAANARYIQHQRQRRIVGAVIVVALCAGGAAAKMFLGKHAVAPIPHSAAAPEGPPPAPPSEVQAATSPPPAQAAEPAAAAGAPAPAGPGSRAELVINSETRPAAAPAPRKASDGQYKQMVAKRVSKGVGAYLQELKGIDRSSLVPPPANFAPAKSARVEAPKAALAAAPPTPANPAK